MPSTLSAGCLKLTWKLPLEDVYTILLFLQLMLGSPTHSPHPQPLIAQKSKNYLGFAASDICLMLFVALLKSVLMLNNSFYLAQVHCDSL